MSELRPRLLAFLHHHDTMSLATIGPAGEPQAAAVFYAAASGLDLYFLSDPQSRHGRNLAREPRVAATIQADGQNWREITGLQIEGTAALVDGVDKIAGVPSWQVRSPAAASTFCDRPGSGRSTTGGVLATMKSGTGDKSRPIARRFEYNRGQSTTPWGRGDE
jgi:uncharacterized protein YhbP (UPF0306 family)